MASYKLLFLDPFGSIQARDEFTAKDDAAAFYVARRLFDVCSDVYASYEVWSGARRIAFPAPGGMQTSVTGHVFDRDEARLAETVVAERVRVLLDSHWTVARSRRLIHEMHRLQATLPGAPTPRHAKHQ